MIAWRSNRWWTESSWDIGWVGLERESVVDIHLPFSITMVDDGSMCETELIFIRNHITIID
jgi:hypothetical protein